MFKETSSLIAFNVGYVSAAAFHVFVLDANVNYQIIGWLLMNAFLIAFLFWRAGK